MARHVAAQRLRGSRQHVAASPSKGVDGRPDHLRHSRPTASRAQPCSWPTSGAPDSSRAAARSVSNTISCRDGWRRRACVEVGSAAPRTGAGPLREGRSGRHDGPPPRPASARGAAAPCIPGRTARTCSGADCPKTSSTRRPIGDGRQRAVAQHVVEGRVAVDDLVDQVGLDEPVEGLLGSARGRGRSGIRRRIAALSGASPAQPRARSADSSRQQRRPVAGCLVSEVVDHPDDVIDRSQGIAVCRAGRTKQGDREVLGPFLLTQPVA